MVIILLYKSKIDKSFFIKLISFLICAILGILIWCFGHTIPGVINSVLFVACFLYTFAELLFTNYKITDNALVVKKGIAYLEIDFSEIALIDSDIERNYDIINASLSKDTFEVICTIDGKLYKVQLSPENKNDFVNELRNKVCRA